MILTKEKIEEYKNRLEFTPEYFYEMAINETKEIKGNILERINENEWQFIRLDAISTHILHSSYTDNDTKGIWEGFKASVNYNMKYGQDRCDAIIRNFDEEKAINIVSSKKFIEEQCKKTSSPLTGELGITRTFEKMADYILYTKFDNATQEKEHEEKKMERMRITAKKKKKRKEAEELRLHQLNEEIKDTPYNKETSKLTRHPDYLKMKNVDELLSQNGFVESKHNVNFTRVDRLLYNGEFAEGEDNFWKRIAPKRDIYNLRDKDEDIIPFEVMGKEVIRQYKDEINNLENLPFNPKRQQVISNLKSEMRTALECFRKIIHFDPTVDMSENVPMDSWNYLSLRDPEIHLALLLGYSELKKKYENKPSTNMWTLLKDWEELVNNTQWNEQEQIIVNFIMDTGVSEYIEVDYELHEQTGIDPELPANTYSYWLNTTIPTKIRDTFERQLENWIWIERRKGIYKTCSKCGQVKLAVDNRYFSKHSKGLYGLQSMCKECDKKRKS